MDDSRPLIFIVADEIIAESKAFFDALDDDAGIHSLVTIRGALKGSACTEEDFARAFEMQGMERERARSAGEVAATNFSKWAAKYSADFNERTRADNQLRTRANSLSSGPHSRAEPQPRGFHWIIAAPLSLWCLVWLALNGYNYLHLTWRIFATLKWISFALLINPCFAIWVGAFSSSVWAPLNFVALPWGSYDAEFSRGKVALLVLFVPPLLGLTLQFIGPYFYPITWGGEDGHHVFLRFIPIFGGKGYE